MEQVFDIEGKKFKAGHNAHWKTTLRGLQQLVNAGRIELRDRPWFVRFHGDYPIKRSSNIFEDTSGKSTESVYVVQTQPDVIQRCLLMATDPGDLVLDPTCGSGTTAYVAEQWGRRWITIDTSRVALALARTRLMAAKFPYYRIAGALHPAANAAGSPGLGEPAASAAGCGTAAGSPDIRRGFVYRQVPHVTLKSIANNPDIKEGMTRQEIDAAFRKHADTETLYDQYEDKGVLRVTGPFTVESLSPHRMLPAGDEAPAQGADAPRSEGDYLSVILDNLRKVGVQNTVKNERLHFDRLNAFPGEYIQGGRGVQRKRCVQGGLRVSIGPEFGTVGPERIKLAALEAIKGSRCDLLLVNVTPISAVATSPTIS